MPYLRRPEGRIAYDLYGEDASGPLVVCVPGMFDHRASFRFVGRALAAAGYRVAVMDLRGHGDSDITFTAHDSRATSTDVIALAEELGGRRVVLVGNSMGAAAVTIAAVDRPDLVAGIALLGPFLRPPTPAWWERTMQNALLLRPWAPWALTFLYDRLHAGRTPEGHDEQRARILRMLRPADRYRSILATIRATNETVDRTEGMAAEAVVIMGEQDPDWKDPHAEARWVASVVGGRLVMVPACGHYAQSQRPDVVAPVLVDLVERVVTDA
ncbi:alpha/beta fold hydrolase [Nocardiopsis sp. MG754419]|uniref:alpha/beta fold hydrolase n=1 Tax=Nocardiopsis sp. MG754419 TaxID=2259865 RepID=UPI001BA92AB2|nr:alpha/beta hydrolase [Nocardiopsis sp. MG754419]MBR8744581.1 alpha/beta hydrolase [Nocardiopsis sp. MG754419]